MDKLKQPQDLFKNIAEMVDSVADIDNLLSVLVIATKRVLNVKASSLLLKDKPSGKLHFHSCVGDRREDITKFELAKGEGIAGWVAERGEAVLAPDVSKDPRWSSEISDTLGFKTRSIACAPLKVEEETFGVLEIIDRLDDEPLNEDDLDRLQAFSDLVAGLLLKARAYREVSKENRMLKQELGGKYEIIGESAIIKKAIESCGKAAQSKATTLITGDSGTGKELFARLLHKLSSRCDKQMISINCGALPETLLERELFGHEKGAFTGADRLRPGLFEAADESTIFLDEIGETSQAMQVKLLRVLQEGTFFRLGGQAPIHVDVRVVAASNKKLEELVANGKFREDLFYRLNVIKIELPLLKERGDDIKLLADSFLKKFNAELNRNIKGFTDEAMASMTSYSWPGNIRQLENTIERAAIMGESDLIGMEDLSAEITEFRKATIKVGTGLKEAMDDFKREFINKTLMFCGGNKTKTAKTLGIQRTYLSRLVKELGVE